LALGGSGAATAMAAVVGGAWDILCGRSRDPPPMGELPRAGGSQGTAGSRALPWLLVSFTRLKRISLRYDASKGNRWRLLDLFASNDGD